MTATDPRAARTALVSQGARLVALDILARDAGLHPEIVRRFVAFGMIEPRGGTPAAPLFRARDAAVLARAARLRRDLGVNVAGAVLAVELLARIDELEARLRARARPTDMSNPQRRQS